MSAVTLYWENNKGTKKVCVCVCVCVCVVGRGGWGGAQRQEAVTDLCVKVAPESYKTHYSG